MMEKKIKINVFGGDDSEVTKLIVRFLENGGDYNILSKKIQLPAGRGLGGTTGERGGRSVTIEVGHCSVPGCRDLLARTGDGFIISFSLSSPISLQEAKDSLTLIQRGRPGEDFPIMLIGNLSSEKTTSTDSRMSQQQQQQQQRDAIQFASLIGATYFEFDSSSDQEVDECFNYLAEEILRSDSAGNGNGNIAAEKVKRKPSTRLAKKIKSFFQK